VLRAQTRLLADFILADPRLTTDHSLHVAVQLLDSALGRPMRSWQFTDKELISIGRAGDSHVQVDDPYVSRTHAELRWQNTSWILVSLGRYGVTVQGHAITELPIQKEITFRLGPEGPTMRFDPAAARNDNRMTMMFDSTLVENAFELDRKKLERDVNDIEQANYFKELQRRAKELRKNRAGEEETKA
jgi:pSer/pThr/pTyr-binding forkhead associated (FHA) protein